MLPPDFGAELFCFNYEEQIKTLYTPRKRAFDPAEPRVRPERAQAPNRAAGSEPRQPWNQLGEYPVNPGTPAEYQVNLDNVAEPFRPILSHFLRLPISARRVA